MNLHGIVSRAIGTVNPPIQGEVLLSVGSYDTLPSGKRVPTPAAWQPAQMQVQALTTKDLMQTSGLNVQGSTHTVYINGRLEGLVRTENKGGDLLRFNWSENGGTPKPRTWLVTCILEDWPDWTKVAVTLQRDT